MERVAEEASRESAREAARKLRRLASDLEQRVNQLHLAKSKSFAWLRADVTKTLLKFETQTADLKRQIKGLELKRVEAPAKPAAPESSPVLEAAVPVVPIDPVPTPAPRAPESKSVQAAKSAETVKPRPRTPTEVRVQPRPAMEDARNPLKAAERHACLRTEVAMWCGEMNRMSGRILRLEHGRPSGISANRWRQLLERARSKHRSAMEKIGVCRRWIHGGPALLSGREDWREDFEQAERELVALREEVAKVMDAPAQVEAEESARPNQLTTRIRLLQPGEIQRDMMKTQLIELPLHRNAD